MSLTSILKDKDSKDLRDKLKMDFLSPKFNIKAGIKAPPLTNNSGIVGTAFDYLMRFYIQFLNKNTFIEHGNWVADSAFDTLTTILELSKKKEIKTGSNNDKTFNTEFLLNLIIDQHSAAKENYINFITAGTVTNELVASTIFLAKLDLYVRTGIIDNSFDFHSPDDIKDITAMISFVDPQLFKAKEKCYSNPTFGTGSSFVGGADADLIIDNTLIDIKATKNSNLDRKYLNQLIGYYILSLIGGVNGNELDKPIENVGIYFARYGILWTMEISDFGDTKKIEDFKDWFISYLTKNH